MNQAALNWISGRDTGVSSKTIWAVCMGTVQPDRVNSWDYDTPHDAGDFGRCYRLLEQVPEWRDRLPEVAEMFPQWKPLVRIWDDITKAYEANNDREVYRLINSVYDEGMTEAGFTKDDCSWTRDGSGSEHNFGNFSIKIGN